MTATVLEQVRMLLEAAGLTASEQELAMLATGYAAQRAGIELLYDLPDARYEDHALVFFAEPSLADWRSPRES
jgi:hypothetical protein